MPVIYTRCVSVIDNDGNKVSKSMVTEKSGAGGRGRRSLNIGRSPENCNVFHRGRKTKGRNIFSTKNSYAERYGRGIFSIITGFEEETKGKAKKNFLIDFWPTCIQYTLKNRYVKLYNCI